MGTSFVCRCAPRRGPGIGAAAPSAPRAGKPRVARRVLERRPCENPLVAVVSSRAVLASPCVPPPSPSSSPQRAGARRPPAAAARVARAPVVLPGRARAPSRDRSSPPAIPVLPSRWASRAASETSLRSTAPARSPARRRPGYACSPGRARRAPAARERATPAAADYCGVFTVQKPLMQASFGSQQSAAVVHLSPTPEHVPIGGVFAQTSMPMAFGSQ